MARSKDPRIERLVSGAIVGVAMGVLAAIAAFTRPDLLERGEFWTYDIRARGAADPGEASPDILIVEIGEEDIEDLENGSGMYWPWRRTVFGYFATYTHRGGARAIVYDWLFQDRSTVADADEFATAMRDAGNVVIGLALTSGVVVTRTAEGRWAAKLRDFDSADEARTVGLQLLSWNTRSYLVPADGGRVTLYYGGKRSALEIHTAWQRLAGESELESLFASPTEGEPPPEPVLLELDDAALAHELTVASLIADRDGLDLGGGLDVPERRGLDPPLAPIIAAPARAGNVFQAPESDGIQRRHIPLVRHDGRLYPSLSLAAYLVAHGEPPVSLDGNVLRVGDRSVPLDDDGRFGIHYHGLHAYRHLRAYPVLVSYAMMDETQQQIRDALVDAGVAEDAALATAQAIADREDSLERVAPIRDALRAAGVADADAQAAELAWPPNNPEELHDAIRATLVGAGVGLDEADATAGRLMAGPQPREPAIHDALVAAGIPEDEVAWRARDLAHERRPVPLAAFAGKYVIVSASGEALRDIRPTPISTRTEGAEINATALDNLEHGQFVVRVAPVTDAAIAFFLALITAVAMVFLWSAIPRAGLALLATSGATFLLLAGYWAIAAWQMTSGVWVAVATPALGTALSAFAALLVTSAMERRGRRFVQEALGRYTSRELVRELMAHPEYLSLEWGEKRPMSVYFSDIAGFTTISEHLPPEKLVRLLNDYLTHMTDLVLEHGGVVDKYIGDAVMAFWGAPLPDPDHARKAVRCAIAMRRRCDELRSGWEAEYKIELRARAGVNSGGAVVGNMGSRHKYNYTVMGDMVNLASRLEGANKPYGTYLMISEFTHAEVADLVDVRELDFLVVKGKEQPVRVYEVLDLKNKTFPSRLRMAEHFAAGLAKYRGRDFAGSITDFERALRESPDDPASMMYIERCRHFIDEPPEEGWDGVWRLEEK